MPEWKIGELPGYEGSAPVRVGNAAANQFQLDVYGEVMDVLYQACKGGLARSDAAWDLQRALIAHLETVWRMPDEGIWEVRAQRRLFTYSKVMAWVAMDRAIKSVESFGVPGDAVRWRALRQRIHDDVCRHGYDASRKSFVQYYGSQDLDASLLLIAITGFLPSNDPRVIGTVEAIRRELMVDGLVMRYRANEGLDGLPPGEGVFLACSFWLADNLVLQGRREEAREIFERLLSLRNDVGLLSEEYEPVTKRFLGNFPQAFSHIALINTAMNLAEGTKPVEQRAERVAV
jgi:GH15 family glucan-1,4-alpha-glucosidase